uniref:[FeFe] hydrogenase H-cluster maturation GTPase HydF n=1 Tax=Candidatus Ruminimicrobium bovinum TaxID=3242779 RepID=UPI0039B82231
MLETPKGVTVHIGIFGRINVGRSTLINYLTGQNISIVSKVAGTTTDTVSKNMELSYVGPATLIDTAGIDDISELSKQRKEKTYKIFSVADVAVIVVEPNVWTSYEQNLIEQLNKNKIPFFIIINNYKKVKLTDIFLSEIKKYKFKEYSYITDLSQRDVFLTDFTKIIHELISDSIEEKQLTDNIIKQFQTVVLVVPIDLGAPKGRLILPQVQMIRSILDINAMAYVVKNTELQKCLDNLKNPPDIVICDSQVINEVSKIVPEQIPLTTFSIIFSANKSDVVEMAKAIEKIKTLKPSDKILIAEACSHHASKDDIGRVKIPKLLSKYLGFDIKFDISSGIDYPKNLEQYSLIIHCGGCMINKKQMISRLNY